MNEINDRHEQAMQSGIEAGSPGLHLQNQNEDELLSQKQNKEIYTTHMIQQGRQLRMLGEPGKQKRTSDIPLDILSPEGLVVRHRIDNKGSRFVKGSSPEKDTFWRKVKIIKSPNKNIHGGWIGWRRDKDGKFSVPIMHPDYKEEEDNDLNFGFK